MKLLPLFILFFIATVGLYAGAWGYKSFENDDARDWVEYGLRRGGLNEVEKIIASVARGRGHLEAPDGCSVLAACELLAAAQGRPSPDLPQDIAAIAKKLSPKPSDAIWRNAREAIDRVLGKDSELNLLWKDAGENFSKWKETVKDLRSRI